MEQSAGRLSRRKKWLIFIVGILAAGIAGYYNRSVLALWGFDVFLSNHVENKLQDSYKPLEGREPTPVVYNKENPFSLLLLGIDQRDKEMAAGIR